MNLFDIYDISRLEMTGENESLLNGSLFLKQGFLI
jgi:hypothetical protein